MFNQNLFAMKKNFIYLVLMALLFPSYSWAQRLWDYDPVSVDEIVPGEDNYYVFQEGYNDKGQSENGFLNSSSSNTLQEVNTSCVYNFIEVDQVEQNGQTFPVYVLKNVDNGKYLTDASEGYTSSLVKAFHFTARKGVMYPEGTDLTSWIHYSNVLVFQQCLDGGAWVLCSPTEQLYIGISYNPSFLPYTSTNNWYVYRATEHQLSAYEKLNETFNKYFYDGFDVEIFPVGSAPGCISQELYNEMEAVYEEANALIADINADPSLCEAMTQKIEDLFVKYNENIIPLTDGYYLFHNRGVNGLAYDAGTKARAEKDTPRPTTWTVDDAKYIWHITRSGTDGLYILQNWGSGQYMGKNPGGASPFPMIADSVDHFTAEHFTGRWFIVKDVNGATINRTAVGDLIRWNSTSENSQWGFEPIPADTIAKLEGPINQANINKKLTALRDEAKGYYEGLKIKNGLTYDGKYGPNAGGLISSLMRTNSELPGNEFKNAVDRNVNSYYHSNWQSGGAPTDDWHWIQMDLGREVQELVVKYSDRYDRQNMNMPVRFAFVAPEDDDVEAPQWLDTLSDTKVEPTYATDFSNGRSDSTTTIAKVTLKRPARYLRFVVLETMDNAIRGFGPTWNVGEFRLYDATETGENPRFTLVPQEIRDAVEAQLTKADEELAAGLGTEETYQALQQAYDAFQKAYPDPSPLESDIASARSILEIAEEGDAEAYYQPGSKAEFDAAISAIEKEVDENEALTLERIAALRLQLQNDLKAFYAKLNVPEGGKVYRIVSTAGYFDDGSERNQNDACMASANADINGDPIWGYKLNEGVDDRFNTLWYVEKTEEGFSFKNLANGLYLNNPYYGLTEEEIEEQITDLRLGYSETPKYFTLGSYAKAGSFIIIAHEGAYLNMDPDGTMVHYGVRNDAHAPFVFKEVTDDDGFSSSYMIPAKPGQVQIMTLPIELGFVYTNNYTAMKVVGKKDGYVQLVPYAEDETIPAGTPFVIKTDAANEETGASAEDFVMADMVNQSIEESLNLTYQYEPVVQNGLVSAPAAFTLEPGYGYLYKEMIVVSEGGEEMEAATGFFNSSIPETEEDGDYVLQLTGDITGEGTAVNGIELVKNAPVDVYTVSGVKVRSGVKVASATKGLPKGIYIVGGKKVIVK